MRELLMILPFENIYPPVNGGMQRCINILNQLARYFEVTVIMHQKPVEFLPATKEFPFLETVKFYSSLEFENKKDIFSFLPRRFSATVRTRWLMRVWNTSADSNLLKYQGLLKSLLQRNHYKVIVLENLSTLNAVSLIRKYGHGTCIIYDAHNIDSNLALDKVQRGVLTQAAFANVRKNESTLYKKIDGLLTCSRSDLDGYEKLNREKLPAAIIPNGVRMFPSLKNSEVMADHPSKIIFCGTLNYYPNAEGLLWFYNDIWPLIKKELPDVKLIVIGSGTPAATLFPLQKDASIIFEGRVNDVKEHYDKAAVAIVPLRQGSGTRLKILEAMSLGIPVVSTSKGAEGIEYDINQNIVIANNEAAFSSAVINLLSASEKRLSITKKARSLIKEKYDWDIIGLELKKFIDKIDCN